MSAELHFFPSLTVGAIIDEADAMPTEKVRAALWRHLNTAKRLEAKEDRDSRRIYVRNLLLSGALLTRLLFQIEGIPQRRSGRIG